MKKMVDFVVKHFGIIMTVLFLISELIGENKNLASNSIYGLIRSILKGEAIKMKPELDHLFETKDQK